MSDAPAPTPSRRRGRPVKTEPATTKHQMLVLSHDTVRLLKSRSKQLDMTMSRLADTAIRAFLSR